VRVVEIKCRDSLIAKVLYETSDFVGSLIFKSRKSFHAKVKTLKYEKTKNSAGGLELMKYRIA
jgi:hypothetical protein